MDRVPPIDTSVVASFERTSARLPHATALQAGGRLLTYAQLGRSAALIASKLSALGVGPGRTAGLCLERSPELIISVLGILKAGGAYVPIDPSYPADRIALMLEDAAPPVVITDKAHQHLFQGSKAAVLL